MRNQQCPYYDEGLPYDGFNDSCSAEDHATKDPVTGRVIIHFSIPREFVEHGCTPDYEKCPVFIIRKEQERAGKKSFWEVEDARDGLGGRIIRIPANLG